MNSVAPFAIFFIGALLIGLTRGHLRSVVLIAVPLLSGWNLLQLETGSILDVEMFGQSLILLRVDKLSMVFAIVFNIAALFGFIFALHVREANQHIAAMLYVGSSMGAVFAGDLITFLIFWELLSLTSVFLVLARGTASSYGSAMRYLLVQVGAGLILLTGILIHIADGGSTAFDAIALEGLGAWLIFIAFGIKCGFPLLHSWIVDSYPEATETGTVFLSAFTTKLAVYALARSFAGTEHLVYIGAAMTLFPIFYAVIENDLRRVLAYSMINQIGFMVVGIGIGTEMAINGAAAHAFTHIIYKGLLFMSMGAVLYRTGKINGSELGGLYKSMPKTAGLCMVGAASISAFPLFSGFISKSMVITAAISEGYPGVWLALLFASAGVFHHAGIKVPFFAFFAHDSGIRCKEAPTHMLVAMTIAAALCIFLGVYPYPLYDLLPYHVDYAPYTAAHVTTQCQLLFFSALAFVVLKLTNLYPPELPGVIVDIDWIYRRLGKRIVRFIYAFATGAGSSGRSILLVGVNHVAAVLHRYHGPTGVLARTLSSGAMVMSVVALLGIYLLLIFLE